MFITRGGVGGFWWNHIFFQGERSRDQSSQQSISTGVGGEDYRKLIANEGGHYNSTVPSWGGGNKVNFIVLM